MMLLKLNPQNPEKRKIQILTETLENGGVIVIPTDTIYCFACDLHNKAAIERIAGIKGLEGKKPQFSVLCQDLKQVSYLTKPISRQLFKILKDCLPGPYTFILPASREVPRLFAFNKRTIGIRIPDNTITRAILEAYGKPLVASSVHDEEDDIKEFLSDPEEIFQRYGKLVDIVVDGGTGDHIASTVIDATGEEPQVIRQGKGEWIY